MTRENLTVSFSDEKCVSTKISETDQNSVFYSLTLKLTNDAIIVTGPEKITFECQVKGLVKEVSLSRKGLNATAKKK